MFRRIALPLLLLPFLLPNHRVAQDKPADASTEPGRITLAECLVLPSVGKYARSPVHIDALEALMLDGKYAMPKAGDTVTDADGEKVAWEVAKADDKGWISGENYGGANAFWQVESDADQFALLHARGHASVTVNGTPHYGDPYGFGNVHTPVHLRKGMNTFFFRMGRGRIKAEIELLGPKPPKMRVGNDWTLPDLVIGQSPGQLLGAVDVINITEAPIEIVPMVVGVAPTGMNERFVGVQQRVPAMSCRKVQFPIPVLGEVVDGDYEFDLKFIQPQGSSIRPENSLASAAVKPSVVRPDQPRRVTFISGIDGSVQYYAVRPAIPLEGATDKPGIVLSLHGAGVEAIGQARAYSSKSWCHIVAPTNRRKFGFDWEDWGRLDAMEVLAHAQATLDNDPTKVWLAGHSMGGHGTWTVGAHFPDRFAAIAPSAGWESFFSYAGGAQFPEEYSVSEILTRTSNPSHTLLHKYNYKAQGVYILHGDADDNVPVSEARHMRDVLKEFHTDLQYFEQPGAGHWWDAGHDNGADCLDWQPIFDMFARHRLPKDSEVQAVDFTTVCPEHSADDHWARIEMQEKQLAPSRVQISLYPNKGIFEGTTENVTRLSLQVQGVISARETITVKLDGSELKDLAWPESGRICLRRDEAGWRSVGAPTAQLKGPQRYGWFKNAMNHSFLLVYGTNGSAEENAWACNKARMDAEQWWYRGNGSVEIIADSEFQAAKYANRGVVLYGNADTNSAVGALVGNASVNLHEGSVKVGDKEVKADDLALLFTYPRKDSDYASVAVIGGTGIEGMRLTDRLGYFVSGASFPDFLLIGPEMLQQGTGGVRAAGYFGEDWSTSGGEVVWNENRQK